MIPAEMSGSDGAAVILVSDVVVVTPHSYVVVACIIIY